MSQPPDDPELQQLVELEVLALLKQMKMRNITFDIEAAERSLAELDKADAYIGTTANMIIIDSFSEVPKECRMIDEPIKEGQEPDGPRKAYWTQPIPDPTAGKPVSSPSKSKRAKLRAKRRGRK